jgi:hypothetical protein
VSKAKVSYSRLRMSWWAFIFNGSNGKFQSRITFSDLNNSKHSPNNLEEEIHSLMKNYHFRRERSGE